MTAGGDRDWLGMRGRRVAVAGAGGLGAACARGFLEARASLAVIDADAARLSALAEAQGSFHAVTVDVSTARGAASAVHEAAAALGGIDVLVHAVGINVRRPVLESTEEDWDRCIAINLSSAFHLARAAAPEMRSRRHGRIIFLSSVSGLLAHRDHGPYAATKGGLNQLMRVMAAEWAADGVTVNAVAPGYTETDLTAEYLERPGMRDRLTALVPAGRLGIAEDVAGPVLFLASDRSAFVTGHVLYVDGGRTLV